MGGSKSASSVSFSSQRNLPLCGCRETMRLWIANTSENPKRKFWKCPNADSNESCGLFIWDDDLEAHRVEVEIARPFSSKDLLKEFRKDFVKEADSVKEFGREFAKEFANEFANDFGKVFAKEFGKEYGSKKIEKMKLKLCSERNKVIWLMWGLLLSWVLFAVLHKLK